MSVQCVNYTDPRNFKSCRKKQYEIWVCKPPVGTIVINKLEQAQAVSNLNGKTYFTVAELQSLKSQNPMLYAQIEQAVQHGMAYCVKEGDLVLSGTRGELWVTSAQKVQNTYACFVNGVWGKNWQAAVQSKMRNGCFDWIKAQAAPGPAGQTMACFVPVSQKGQIQTSWAVLNFNAPGVDHGLGDFILCSAVGGKPNLADCWVVNGAVFADTYNNQGWQQCLKTSVVAITAPEPPKLFEVHSASSGNSAKVEKCGNLILSTFIKSAPSLGLTIIGQKHGWKTVTPIESVTESVHHNADSTPRRAYVLQCRMTKEGETFDCVAHIYGVDGNKVEIGYNGNECDPDREVVSIASQADVDRFCYQLYGFWTGFRFNSLSE